MRHRKEWLAIWKRRTNRESCRTFIQKGYDLRLVELDDRSEPSKLNFSSRKITHFSSEVVFFLNLLRLKSFTHATMIRTFLILVSTPHVVTICCAASIELDANRIILRSNRELIVLGRPAFSCRSGVFRVPNEIMDPTSALHYNPTNFRYGF